MLPVTCPKCLFAHRSYRTVFNSSFTAGIAHRTLSCASLCQSVYCCFIKHIQPMEPREQELLSLYQERLVDQLKPNDLQKHLIDVGAFHEDDFAAILRLNELPKEVHVEGLLDALKTHHDGLTNLVKSLLLSDKYDALVTEILGDQTFDEYDINNLLEDLRGRLSEVQILKLELLKERKKHYITKRELEEVKSNRNSIVFSDYDSSYCSGFDSSDTDNVTGYLLRELEEEKTRREEAEYLKNCHEEELIHTSKKNRELEASHNFLLRQFKSVEDMYFAPLKDEKWHKRFPWKAASVADLFSLSCERAPGPLHNSSSDGTLTKWTSDDSGAQLREYSGVLALAEKVSDLELQLSQEKDKRMSSELEISKLEYQNKQLQFELDEARGQLLETSQQDLTRDSMLFENDDIWNQEEYDDVMSVDTGQYGLHIYGHSTLGKGFSCPALNLADVKFRQYKTTSQENQRMRRPVSYHGSTDVSNIWQNRNVEHYEMDEYEQEMEKKPDPDDADFKYVLRRLKLKAWNLYHDIIMGSAELKILGNRAERLRSYHTLHI